MRFYYLLLIVFLLPAFAVAQSKGNWYRFTDAKTGLTGYKDAAGKVKVQAKFGLLTSARVFRNIIPVQEQVNQLKFQSYYLLKNGKRVGVDSTYSWDFALPFESEGKIIFRDKITDRVGFFDSNGKITIPAVYNDAMPFHNGMALVIRNGKRICWDGGEATESNPCEHWNWKGLTSIINDKNDILVDSLDLSKLPIINWYSLKIGEHPLDTSLYVNLKGVNGRVYSFIDYKKEFTVWFKNKYLAINNISQLNQYYIKAISGEINRRKYTDKQAVIQVFPILLRYLNNINNNRKEIDIEADEILGDVYENRGFESFYNDSGEHDIIRYPAFIVYVGKHKNTNEESLRFLRTGYGYKLFSVVLTTHN